MSKKRRRLIERQDCDMAGVFVRYIRKEHYLKVGLVFIWAFCYLLYVWFRIDSRVSSPAEPNKYFDLGFDLSTILNPPYRSFKRGGFGTNDVTNCNDDQEVTKVLRQRSARVRRLCDEMGLDKSYSRLELFHTPVTVNRLERAYMCVIPKAGISSWNMLMLQMSGFLDEQQLEQYRLSMYSFNASLERNITELGIKKFPQTHQLRFEETNAFLLNKTLSNNNKDSFIGWTQTRHPFERLLSSYRDKVLERPLFIEDMIRHRSILNKSSSLVYKDPPSFPEFVDYVIYKLSKAGLNPDSHYRPHYDLCHPCSVHYDFFLHYEDVARESQHVLARLGRCDLRLPRGEDPAHRVLQGPSTVELMQHFYSQLTLLQIGTLYKLYEKDFVLMGYANLPGH